MTSFQYFKNLISTEQQKKILIQRTKLQHCGKLAEKVNVTQYQIGQSTESHKRSWDSHWSVDGRFMHTQNLKAAQEVKRGLLASPDSNNSGRPGKHDDPPCWLHRKIYTIFTRSCTFTWNTLWKYQDLIKNLLSPTRYFFDTTLHLQREEICYQHLEHRKRHLRSQQINLSEKSDSSHMPR